MSAPRTAPKRIAVNYPLKTSLSEAEALDVLRNGPDLAWFRVFADHLRSAPETSPPWGYIHVHSEWGNAGAWTEADLVWDVVGFDSAERLRWAVESLYTRSHDYYAFDRHGYLNDHNCHGIYYWLSSDPKIFPIPLGVDQRLGVQW